MKLTFKTHKNIEVIFDYLTDMQKFVSVHPVIYKIDQLSENNYLVFETLKFGFIPFSFTYPVVILKNEIEKSVIIKATVFRLTKIEMRFILKAENDVTDIHEEILIKSPLPVKFMMEGIFRKQHHQLFNNIELK